jgi:hypothetical protein
MKKAAYILLIIEFFLLTAIGLPFNEKVIFHKIRFTASSVELVQWNITDTSNTAFVQETIDDLGRVLELKFYNDRHQIDWAGSGFYGGPIIKYEYGENVITETFFSTETDIANDFRSSEVPFRFIYHLNHKHEIVKTEMKYKIDFEWTNESLESTIEHLELYKQYAFDGSNLNRVFGYSYSLAKMNGLNPK